MKSFLSFIKIFFQSFIIIFIFQNVFASEKKIATEEEVKKLYESIVRIYSIVPPDARTANSLGTERRGSGVIIDDKHILTIGYIVVEADTINIGLPGGKTVPGELVGYDHTSGFGILRTINSTKLNPLKLGDSDEIKVDELLFVMPYPDQGQASAANAVSRRSFAGWWEYYLDKPIYTFPMNYSWAGTPLINQQGEILGIGSLFVSESLSPGVSSPGNLFVPINDLKPILKDLIDNGRRTKNIKPYMGLSSEDSTGKVSVTRVNENGPAAKAGIMPNDVILSVNGKDVRNMTEFYKTVWGLGGPGTVLKLDIDRNEQRLSFELTTMDRNDFFVKPKYY